MQLVLIDDKLLSFLIIWLHYVLIATRFLPTYTSKTTLHKTIFSAGVFIDTRVFEIRYYLNLLKFFTADVYRCWSYLLF